VDRIARVSARNRRIADPLRRSAESIVLNFAEGAGQYSPGRRIHHYQLARGFAGECIAALTHLYRRNPSEMIASSRGSANMVSAMLTALVHSH
jgi:four helix bundle protein